MAATVNNTMRVNLSKMKSRMVGLLLVLIVASGCGSPLLPSDPVTTEARTTPSLFATPTVDVVTPERVGRAFLEAWQQSDYSLMYGLLTPALRTVMTAENFRAAYTSNLNITTAVSVTLLPQTLRIDNDKAWVDFQEIWHTALFGQLQANNVLDLVRENDQWWVAWKTASVWPDLKNGNQFAIEYQIPPRANIYDHTGAGMAIPAKLVTVGVVPNRIEDEIQLLNTLSQVLGMAPDAIRALYAGQPETWYIPIKDITGEESLANDAALQIPGVERRERTGRVYSLGGIGAHAVGWVASIPAEAYDAYRQRGYRGDELVGITGIEAWGEQILAGKNGARLYLVSADGSYVGSMAERNAERGRAIYTTLDRGLQAAAEQALGDYRGAVVALDINTGAIRALASGPTFDSNIFLRSTDEWLRQATLYDPDQPLLNRATLGQYPAGSVFKIITIAAALGPGGMSPDSPFYCVGYWDGLGIPNRKFCWLETGHGDITLIDGLSASCNVVYYEVGSRLNALDPYILPNFARAFGLGEETGLEQLTEAAGLVPDPDWKEATYQQSWGTGDTVNMAIGQGYILVTPLQIARMISAVANGGTLYQPTLVARISASDRIPEQVSPAIAVGHLPVSEQNLSIIRDGMLGVTTNVEIGTATHRFRGLGIAVAGKTGTAEIAQEGALPHSWFAGYFPADAPEFAMAIVLDNAGEGSSVAAPLFRQVIEGYYGLPITPLPEITPTP